MHVTSQACYSATQMPPANAATVPPSCHLPGLLQCHPDATCQCCYSATEMPPARPATVPPRCHLPMLLQCHPDASCRPATVPPRCHLPMLLQCPPDANCQACYSASQMPPTSPCNLRQITQAPHEIPQTPVSLSAFQPQTSQMSLNWLH